MKKNLFKEKEISGTLIPSYKISIIMISYRVWVEKINKYFSRNWFHGKNEFFLWNWFHREDKNVFSWNWYHIWWFERGRIFSTIRLPMITPNLYVGICLCVLIFIERISWTSPTIQFYISMPPPFFFLVTPIFHIRFRNLFLFTKAAQRITEQRPDGKSSS